MMRVSELITVDEIKKWNTNEIVTITAGTGQGKSWFIKNTLYDHAKQNNQKILMLLHRTNCVSQFQTEIERDRKADVIDIKTYQYIEHLYKSNTSFDFSDYQYICLDEFHYFLQDASYNFTTDISLNVILDQTDKVRIFMSATSHYITKYINNYRELNMISYELPIEFKFIEELTFFNKDETMEKFIEEAIEGNKKTIFFIQSAKKAYHLYEKFKDVAVFNCSRNNKEFYKYVDGDKIEQILNNEKYEKLIFITTLCFDAGINLVDTELKHVVCDVKDKTSLIQCIGRKRIQNDNDRIYLYIKNISNKSLGGIETQLNKKREMAKYLLDHSNEEFIRKYQRTYDSSNMIYLDVVEGEKDFGTLKVNEMMYFKCLTDLVDISNMKTHGEYAYCKFMSLLFGFYDEINNHYNYRIIEEDSMKNSLEDYLKTIVGKKLFKGEQKELINKIDLRVDGKQQKSYKKLNDGLEMINSPFVILPKKSGSTRYWIIENIER